MEIVKIAVTLADREQARTLAGALQELVTPSPEALTLFEERGAWRIEAYYADARAGVSIHEQLAGLFDEPLPALVAEGVPDLNWVALSQAALPPVQAGRFRVFGGHDRDRVARGPGAILIEAGEAFGTSHHATTYGCLLAIDRLTRRRVFRRVLDLGCGTAVLAIASARALPQAKVVASDIDERSVEIARANAAANGVASRVRVVQAEGLNAPALRGEPFDFIVANILAEPLVALAKALARAAGPGAVAVLSGLLPSQAPSVAAAYRSAGFVLLERRLVSGWSVLILERATNHHGHVRPSSSIKIQTRARLRTA